MLYDPALFQNENIDRVRHRGVELQARYRAFEWVELYASYTYENTEIRDYARDSTLRGKQLPVTPENRGTVGLVLFLPVDRLYQVPNDSPVDAMELGINANIVGPRYVANDLANQLPELPTYGTIDLYGRFEKKVWGLLELALFFEIRNVADTRYSGIAGDRGFGTVGVNRVGYYPSPGRNFDVGLSVGIAQ